MKARHFYLLLLIATAIVFSSWDAAARDIEGLVFYLSFEEFPPVDHAANPAKLSIKGNLKQVDGKFGKGLEFDGKSANIIEVEHSDKLEGMRTLTIEAWVKPRKIGAQEGMCIASKRIAFEQADVYNLFLWTGQTMRARVNGKGEIASKTVFEDDKWYHVAYIFDGGAMDNEKAKLHVNGELETSGTHPDQAVGKGGASLWIGELDTARGFAWNGIIDEVGIWNKALSADEIKLAMEGKLKMMPVEPQGKLTTTWANIKR